MVNLCTTLKSLTSRAPRIGKVTQNEENGVVLVSYLVSHARSSNKIPFDKSRTTSC